MTNKQYNAIIERLDRIIELLVQQQVTGHVIEYQRVPLPPPVPMPTYPYPYGPWATYGARTTTVDTTPTTITGSWQG